MKIFNGRNALKVKFNLNWIVDECYRKFYSFCRGHARVNSDKRHDPKVATERKMKWRQETTSRILSLALNVRINEVLLQMFSYSNPYRYKHYVFSDTLAKPAFTYLYFTNAKCPTCLYVLSLFVISRICKRWQQRNFSLRVHTVINYSCSQKPINDDYLGQVDESWYLMKHQIKRLNRHVPDTDHVKQETSLLCVQGEIC